MEAPGAQDVDTALTPVREILQPDGADVEILGWDREVLALKLRLEGVNCAECVLPRENLQQTMLTLLQPALPTLREIRLTDPRETDVAQT